MVDSCQAYQIKILFSVVTSPLWANNAGTVEAPPADFQDFFDFLRALVSRYKGRVQAYEIWNEQNLLREWHGQPLSAAKYMEMLKGAYQTIKAIDPNAIVVSGAPTPTGVNDGVTAIDDRLYLQQMYKHGLKYYCDAIGVHPSGFANSPDAKFPSGNDPNRGFDDHPSFFFRNTLEDYHNIIVANGDNKRLWATEFGWATVDQLGCGPAPGYEFATDINEQQQADYIVRAFQRAKSYGWCGVMFLWNLNFAPVAGPCDEKAAYSILRADWTPRPAYYALKNMAK